MNFTSVSEEQTEVGRNERYISRLVSFHSNLYGFSFHIKVLLHFHERRLLFFCPLLSYALSLHVCPCKSCLPKSKQKIILGTCNMFCYVFSRTGASEGNKMASLFLSPLQIPLLCCKCQLKAIIPSI
jgi:hypothetical protein